MTDETNERLLSNFIDILNKYGTDSQEAENFLEQHKNNKKLLPLLEHARVVKKRYERQRKRKIIFLVITLILGVSLFIGLILFATTAYGQNSAQEEIRVVNYTYRTVVEYRFNDRRLATHNRLFSRSLELQEDRLMVFSVSRNNFLIISSNDEGRLNSVSVNGNVRECSSLENTALCEQSLKLTRMWRNKLIISGELLGEDRELDSSMQQFVPPGM